MKKPLLILAGIAATILHKATAICLLFALCVGVFHVLDAIEASKYDHLPDYTSQYMLYEGEYREVLTAPNGDIYIDRSDEMFHLDYPDPEKEELVGIANGSHKSKIYRYEELDPDGIFLVGKYKYKEVTNWYYFYRQDFSFPEFIPENIDAVCIVEEMPSGNLVYKVSFDEETLSLFFDIIQREMIRPEDMEGWFKFGGLSESIHLYNYDYATPFSATLEIMLYSQGGYYLKGYDLDGYYEISVSEAEALLASIRQTAKIAEDEEQLYALR